MPLKPSDLVSKTGRRIVVEPDDTGTYHLAQDGESTSDAAVAVWYRASALTVAEQEDLQERITSGGPGWVIDTFLARVAKWDLEDDNGAPFPLDADRLRAEVPSDFLFDVIGAINEDSGLGKALMTALANGQGSSAG